MLPNWRYAFGRMTNRLLLCNHFGGGETTGVQSLAKWLTQPLASSLHSSPAVCINPKSLLPIAARWERQNRKVYPPQEPEEVPREAYICHYRSQIKYSPKKMMVVAQAIRGLSIDEAIKQCTFMDRKGGLIVREILQEAQELAVKEHNIEFKSNMWVAESFATRGTFIHGIRRHARMRFGRINYRYCHYFVRLVEGEPPEHYYDAPLTPDEKLQQWKNELANRRIPYTL